MNPIKKFLGLLLIVSIIVVFYFAMTREQIPEKLSWDTASIVSGDWSRTEDALVFSYPLRDIPTSKPTMLLQSAWTNYQVLVDDTSVYTSSCEKNGTFHLLALPQGQTLTIRFFCTDSDSADSVMQSKVCLGSKSSIYHMLVKKNLYAVVFWIVTLLLGIAAIFAGFYIKSKHFGNFFSDIISLGLYILLAGVWVITDSTILMLITPRSGLVKLISFLCFYAMHIPLLQFTTWVLPAKKKLLEILQHLFIGMMFLQIISYIGDLHIVALLLLAEHILLLTTLALVLYFGFRELRHRKRKALRQVMIGYSIFFFCCIMTILFYYTGNFYIYSFIYIAGILGFIFFLVDIACLGVLGQIQENANMAMYAKMAYVDGMTGLRNRAAFTKEQQQTASSASSLGYIMVDINDLKKVNDTLGHRQGDALIIQVAQCIQQAVASEGNCYRIGGDEFVVSLSDSCEKDVLNCSARIRKELQMADAQGSFPISAALGCAWSPLNRKTPEVIFQQADDAMYAEKKIMKARQQDI